MCALVCMYVCTCVCVHVYSCELIIGMYICYRCHHNDVLVAWISLILFRHSSQSSVASGRSTRLHPVSVFVQLAGALEYTDFTSAEM